MATETQIPELLKTRNYKDVFVTPKLFGMMARQEIPGSIWPFDYSVYYVAISQLVSI